MEPAVDRKNAERAQPDGSVKQARHEMDDLPHHRNLDARQSLQSIYAKFTEGFATEDIVSAKHLLDRGQVSESW